MVWFLRAFLIICAVSISWVNARHMSIDEDITAAELKSSDAQMHQADGSILVELDMRLTQEQWAEMQKMRNGNGTAKRNALRNLKKRWTNAVLPYAFDKGFSSPQQETIRRGIDQWNKYSCVKIRPKQNSDKRSVLIVPKGGCTSFPGMSGLKVQKLTLGPGCIQRGIVAHEFGHALGFHHEQTRPDRDNYVRILENNINPRNLHNFKKYDWSLITSYKVPYDYESIMHYGGRGFSINGKMTIQTIDPKYQKVIGNRFGISFLDIKLINLMYDCNKKCPKKTCPGDGFVGKDCKCWCKGPGLRNPTVYCDTKEPIAGGNAIGSKSTKPTTTEIKDNHVNCPAWARLGECRKNPDWMLANCKKSCRSA